MKQPATLAFVVIGVALELGVRAVSGRREAWDSPAFWTIGLPLAMAASAAVGYAVKGRAWLAALVVAPSQFMTMTIVAGELGGLWPVGLVLSTILSAPFVAAAFAGSRFRPKD